MRAVSTALCAVLAFSAPALARDMTPQEWDGLREQYSKIATRHENISHCTAVFLDLLSQDLVREIEAFTKSQGREAMADFCAALVMSIAEGEITHEDVYGAPE